MRRLFTAADAADLDITRHGLAWGVRSGFWVRVTRAVYAEGPEPPTSLDRQRALVLARSTVARGSLGGVLLGLDSVRLDGRPTRERMVPIASVVDGVPCASATQVLIDLAASLDDDTWEQALDSALRLGLTTVEELESWLPRLTEERLAGSPRVRRVLARRPPGAPPTESLLETLALQLARATPLGELTRQHVVTNDAGTFVARVDLCNLDLGAFLELDGQHHAGQPVHDSARQTAIVAATGWLPGRFTWHEITRTPRTAQRRMTEVAEQAARRRSH
jgi:very-short-patch-repair endonuclease